MNDIPFLFNQTAEQMRRIGARGGRTHARNCQARQRAAGAGQRETAVPVAPPRETTTQAVAVLDAQFAWLRGAEKPGRQRRTGLPNSAQRQARQGTSPRGPSGPADQAGTPILRSSDRPSVRPW